MKERVQRSVTAYVALGSNVGLRERHLRDAVRRLDDHPLVSVVRTSPIYESPAHTLDPSEAQPPFLNAVVELSTRLNPIELLELCHQIERHAGRDRNRAERWAPRTLDIDILLFGLQQIEATDLSIPHPRMPDRRFVLKPLSDLAPNLWIPKPHSATVQEMLDVCPDPSEPARTPLVLADDTGHGAD